MKLRIKMFLTIDREVEVTNENSVEFAEEKIIKSMKKEYGGDLIEVNPYEITTEDNKKFVKKYSSWIMEG